jgi:flagellar biosynthetic protein FliP
MELFIKVSGGKKPEKPADVALTALIPAFVISELKTAFQIGFLIYIPFLVIDMVVASILLSMGMMMLPPIMISLPFKRTLCSGGRLVPLHRLLVRASTERPQGESVA